MNGWKLKKVSELCELIVDCVNKTAPHVSYPTPYKMIRTPNIRDGKINLSDCRFVEAETYKKWTRRATVDEGDVLLTREAPMGEVGRVGFNDTVFLGQRIVQYRADPSKLDSHFLLYSFRSGFLQAQFRKHDSSGSIVSHIPVPACTEFEIPTPPLPTQQKIAKVLSALDAKIELNQRMNEELEGMAKLLYDYWFVQYDFPMSAAQAAALGKPHLTGHPYRASGGPMTYHETLKREIPTGWEAKALCDLTEVSKDSVDPAEEPERLFKLFSIPGFDETGTYLMAAGSEIGSNKFVVTENDLLVSKLNPWTSRVIYADADIEAVCSTEFVVWRTATEWQKAFLYMVARGPQFIAFCSQSATGTSNSHKRVNPTVMMSYTIPWSKEAAKAFGETVSPMLLAMQSNKVQTQELTTLRDWLLPMLMNGQVTVG